MEDAATRNPGGDLSLDNPRIRNLFRDKSTAGRSRKSTLSLKCQEESEKVRDPWKCFAILFAERFKVARTTECRDAHTVTMASIR
jgi:hypothetical protein